MADINLLKGEKRRGYKPEGHISISAGRPVIWVFVAILILSLGAYGVFHVMRSNVETELLTVKAAVADAEQKMRTPPPKLKDAVKAQSALRSLSGLLDKHTYWTKLWDELGNRTFKASQYLTISATEEKSDFIIEGRVSSFEQLGKLMLGLQESEGFTDVQLVSSGPGKGEVTGIEFSFAVKYDPELLLDKAVSTGN